MTLPIAVVIPAHGDPVRVQRVLIALDTQAIQLAEGQLLVVVVDDATPTPLGESLDTALSGLELRLVRRAVNGGPGAARNRGLEEITTPWVAFLDADMLPGPGWVARLRWWAQRHDGADGIEGRVDVPAEDSATAFTHTTEFGESGTHHGAGNVAYRTQVLRDIGGFDERFFDPKRRLHFREDTDLYFRAVDAGASVSYDPELVALHPPLDASLMTPIRLARRYYFDPLLSLKHPAAFRRLNDSRRVGPISLRRARHDSAVVFALGLTVTIGGVASHRRRLSLCGAVALVIGWTANCLALAWRRQVRPRDIPPLAAVAAVTPLVYLWNYYRGALRFGHRPRL